MNRLLLAAFALCLSCELSSEEEAHSLAAALREIDGIEVVNVSAQRDEIVQGGLFDATIRAQGRTLTLLALDPKSEVGGPIQPLVMLSIDGLYPQCRLSTGETEGGIELASDARTADLGIRGIPDLATKAEDLHARLSQFPRSEENAVRLALSAESYGRCWIHETP